MTVMTKIIEIAFGTLNSLALLMSGLQIIAINIESKNGTNIFAAVLIPANIIKIAATVTNALTIELLCELETMKIIPYISLVAIYPKYIIDTSLVMLNFN
jgi:hypothetical protein